MTEENNPEHGRFQQKYAAMRELGFWKFVFGLVLRFGYIIALVTVLSDRFINLVRFALGIILSDRFTNELTLPLFFWIVFLSFLLVFFLSIFYWSILRIIAGLFFKEDYSKIKSGKYYDKLMKENSTPRLKIDAYILLGFIVIAIIIILMIKTDSTKNTIPTTESDLTPEAVSSPQNNNPLPTNSVSTTKAVYPSHYKYTMDPVKDTIVHEITFSINDAQGSSYSLKTAGIELGILDWKQSGGKKCAEIIVSNYTIKDVISTDFSPLEGDVNYTYFTCNYENDLPLNEGDIQLQITSKCGFYCYFKNLNLWVIPYYPKEHNARDLSGVSIQEIINTPKGYDFKNIPESIPKLFHYETTEDGIVISIEKRLESDDILDDSLFEDSNRLINFKKSADFSSMKTLKKSIFTLIYPAGVEDEAQALMADLIKILPEFEKYAGFRGNYDGYKGITIRFIEDYSTTESGSTTIPKDGGRIGEIVVNLKEITDITPFHELCHLSEKPFIFPSWLADGQAINCGEIKFMEFLGRFDDAKEAEEDQIFSTKIFGSSPDLSTWNWYDNKETAILAGSKGYGLSYLLMKDVLQYVDMPTFYSQMRRELKAYYGHDVKVPNDVLICKMNEIATGNIIPIFKNNGFEVSNCNRLKICSNDQIYGETREGSFVCANQCDNYFCKSDIIDTSSPNNPCPNGFATGDDNECHQRCKIGGTYCGSGSYCYENTKCIRCPEGETLYDNEQCY